MSKLKKVTKGAIASLAVLGGATSAFADTAVSWTLDTANPGDSALALGTAMSPLVVIALGILLTVIPLYLFFGVGNKVISGFKGFASRIGMGGK